MTRTVQSLLPALLCSALIAACGGDDPSEAEPDGATTTTASPEQAGPPEGDRERKGGGGGDRGDGGEDRPEKGTTIVTGDSQFGEMLYDANDQAIYIFERDGEDKTVCYGECAEAWPPVLTEGEPRGEAGVDAALLGTIERDDGTTQVTYAGQPLYFYAHEGPGEVRCHNVNLNGGFWWVVGPDGERLA